MEENTICENLFKDTEITDLCDSVKYNHEIIITVEECYGEIKTNHEQNGNGLPVEIKKWAFKNLTKGMIHKQLKKTNRIKEIYEEVLDRL